jgi:hypothetical protein
MDAIYDFAINPDKDKKAEGVVFRFMPDAREVQSALEVRLLTHGRLLLATLLFGSKGDCYTLPVGSNQT